ncbi:MAG: restriction endonuclease subunit S [Spirochaetaceae bacterium]|jgi:type I restriction enzyme S subunit|nr:restriction endonuclease subunit S [Spirochaetaceae bacterium]
MNILGNFIIESKERASHLLEHDLPVYGVDRSKGLTSNAKYKSKDTTNYKVIRPGMFAYNPMRLNIGSIAFCTSEHNIGLVSPDYIVFKCNETVLDPVFLNYTIEGVAWQQWIKWAGVGSVRIRIYFKELATMPFKAPSLFDQKIITHILDSLNDKIKLNQQMNVTLERMAQALFDSWFKNFDPVIDNALSLGNPIPEEIAKNMERRKEVLSNGNVNCEVTDLFPNAFQYTEEMGWIPKDWSLGNIGDIVKSIGGFAFKKQAFIDSGFPVIKIKNIKGDGTVLIKGAQCIGTDEANKALKFSLRDGDLLMAMTGATVGKIGILVIDSNNAFLNQRVAKLEGRNIENFTSFLFCFFKDQENFKKIVEIAGGSAQPNISTSGIESVQCVIPKNDTLIKFVEIVHPYFEKWILNYKQSNILSNLCETLLPKLISGEISIFDAELLNEEVYT